jgi:hypothetical protein
MKYTVCYLSFLLYTLRSSLGAEQTEIRVWNSKVGTTVEARFIAEKQGFIRLEKPDGSRITVKLDQLSDADHAYVDSATEVRGATEIEGVSAGQYSGKIACAGDAQWHYYVYLPKEFHTGRDWPVWFIMSPGGGKSAGPLKRYVRGADFLGCILVLSVESKNGFGDSELAAEAMVKDVFERFPVAEELSFASGFSGGARMSYRLAEMISDLAWVLACGSGHGVYPRNGDFRDAELRDSTYVYNLVGTNCFNRTGTFKSHETFPDDFRMRYFPGNHTWAGTDLIKMGMARVLAAGLERYDDDDASKLRRTFSRTLWAWTQEQVESAPWEAYYWAGYLQGFEGVPTIQKEASALAKALSEHPRVIQALNAEKDMHRLGSEYFGVFYKEDKKPNSDRKRDAETLANKYPDVPHADLLRMLGDPCK